MPVKGFEPITALSRVAVVSQLTETDRDCVSAH